LIEGAMGKEPVRDDRADADEADFEEEPEELADELLIELDQVASAGDA
jgi:hypothetical protein